MVRPRCVLTAPGAGGSLQQLGDSSERVELLAVKVIIAIKDFRSIKLQIGSHH
jgi:hypothetical protein